jgi:ssDNA-binding Zn-finger/Zn-ribbon topoisomerase 1
MKELFPTESRLKISYARDNMKLQQVEKPCKRCGRKLILVLDDHRMCIGCNFMTDEKRYTRFYLNGWVFRDLGDGIEVERAPE